MSHVCVGAAAPGSSGAQARWWATQGRQQGQPERHGRRSRWVKQWDSAASEQAPSLQCIAGCRAVVMTAWPLANVVLHAAGHCCRWMVMCWFHHVHRCHIVLLTAAGYMHMCNSHHICWRCCCCCREPRRPYHQRRPSRQRCRHTQAQAQRGSNRQRELSESQLVAAAAAAGSESELSRTGAAVQGLAMHGGPAVRWCTAWHKGMCGVLLR